MEPKVVLGDFNEWGRGFATIELTRVLKSLDLRAFLKRRRTYPGIFPRSSFRPYFLRWARGSD